MTASHKLLFSFLLLVFSSSLVLGFSEDMCFYEGTLYDCAPYNPNCPSGLVTRECSIPTTQAWNNGTNFAQFARSSVHVDATYYMMVAMGFNADFAFWTIAYSEAIDYGNYTQVDKCYQPMHNYSTTTLQGFNRLYLCGGGTDYHVTIDPGMNRTEPLRRHLKQLQNWAFRQSDLLCMSGLTEPAGPTPYTIDSYFMGDSCYCAGESQDMCPGQILALRGVGVTNGRHILLRGYTGKQVMDYDFQPRAGELSIDMLDNRTICNQTGLKFVDEFDSHIAASHGRLDNGAVPDSAARLGVLIHSIGDALSHNDCNNAQHWTLPSPHGVFIVRFDEGYYCDQDFHALYHYFESGHNQTFFTTDEYFFYAYRTLSEFKSTFQASHPEWFNASVTPAAFEDIHYDAMHGLFALDGTAPWKTSEERINYFVNLLKSKGLPQMPGYGDAYQCATAPSDTTTTTGTESFASVIRPFFVLVFFVFFLFM